MSCTAKQDGTIYIIHEGDRPEESDGAWLSIDVETVAPRLMEPLQ